MEPWQWLQILASKINWALKLLLALKEVPLKSKTLELKIIFIYFYIFYILMCFLNTIFRFFFHVCLFSVTVFFYAVSLWFSECDCDLHIICIVWKVHHSSRSTVCSEASGAMASTSSPGAPKPQSNRSVSLCGAFFTENQTRLKLTFNWCYDGLVEVCWNKHYP